MGNIEKIERLTSQIKNLKVAGAKAARIGTNGVLTGGGGAVAGFVHAKLPKVPNTNLDTAGAVGVGLLIAAAGDVFDNYSEHVGAFAGGMLAYAAGRETYTYAASR